MKTEPLNINITKEHKRRLQWLVKQEHRSTMTAMVEKLIDAEYLQRKETEADRSTHGI